MSYRITSWPKILAVLVGGIGVSGIFSALMLSSTVERTWITCDWRVIVASALLLIISFLLATGREWARRILLFAVVLIGIGLVLEYALRIVGTMSFTDLRPEQVKVVRLWTRLTDLS